ncbi:MAG: hypothetical protein WBV94_11075 [Blastocatellia bacterium]
MKTRTKLTLILFALASMMISGSRLRSTNANPVAVGLKRMQFQIATIQEHAGARTVISSSVVEGPPGTDFDIDLQGERFKMNARFLTDFDESRALAIRAKLQTRRLYGRSAQGLPLYEEDEQSQTLRLGLDEQIVLLPFGRGGGDDRLKIEITPAMTEESVYTPAGELRPLTINILKISPDGIINIHASKIPHRYEAEVRLLEDGREIARSAASLMFDEPHELLLRSDTQAVAVSLKIDGYTRSRPSDLVEINFDIHRLDDSGRREPVRLNGAGTASLGSDISYDLSERYHRKYELRFNIKIASGEMVD